MKPNLIISEQTRAMALKHARGSYQIEFLRGRQCISGADLKGEALRSKGSYMRSLQNLLGRLRQEGLRVSEIKGDHGKRICVIRTYEEDLRAAEESSQ